MSRKTIYEDDTIEVVSGIDHICGYFVQVYDKNLETPEGEGLILDWSDHFNTGTNFTGMLNPESSADLEKLIINYIKEYSESINETQLNNLFELNI
jgi:hypothetical protein